MKTRSTILIIGGACFWASQATGQAPTPDVEAVRRAFVAQPFYPADYANLRIAAELSEITEEDLDHSYTATYDSPECCGGPRIWHITVLSCEFPSSEAPTSRERVLELAAIRTVEIRAELPRYGYDREIFEQPVLDYERRMISLAELAPDYPEHDAQESPATQAYRAFEERLWEAERVLLRDIDHRRSERQPNTPAIRHGAGCGDAGDTPYIIRTLPDAGRTWMVSMFRFFHCQTRLSDPWNVSGCTAWREYHSDQPSYPLGRYMYQVRWADGSATRGDHTFETSGFDPIVVTLRRD